MAGAAGFQRARRSAWIAALAMLSAPAVAAPKPPVGRPPMVKPAVSKADQQFAQFIEKLRPWAEAAGVSRATFDAAFRNVRFDPKVVALTKAQPEFAKPIWVYLATAVSPSRIQRGQEKSEAVQEWLHKAESQYGVDPAVILGIWGMETEFGAFQGADNVIRSLASLAFVHYRGDYFRDELLSALKILQDENMRPAEMVGSWAGAMGQTQFMPSSFLEFAVDFDGAGRRDIWKNPADAIGSTANYLAKHGWKAGEPWGYEVKFPEGFRLTAADSSEYQPFYSFKFRGVERTDGGSLPTFGEAKLLLPGGLHGPAFLVTHNFQAIKAYNNSTSYALGVALLGDAILKRPSLQGSWPVHERLLTQKEVRELQMRLHALGYEVGEIDGMPGETLHSAVRAYQEDAGLPPDGFATPILLQQMKATAVATPMPPLAPSPVPTPAPRPKS